MLVSLPLSLPPFQLSKIPIQTRNHLTSLIDSSPAPEQVVRYIQRFVSEAPAEFLEITEQPAALRCLITVFGYSAFLSDAVIRHPSWLSNLASADDIGRVLRTEDYVARLERFLKETGGGIPSAFVLASFRRREILRILLRDVLRFGTLSDVTEELSNLADAILDVALRSIRAHFSKCLDAPSDGLFSVIALGKLGGGELNYSSDIDLMFVYSAPESDEHHKLTHKELFKKVSNQLTELLSTYTRDGMCYRVDLRLRPDGRHGEVCMTLEGAKQYYRTRGRDWELQMLIKARVAAGDPGPGRELLEFVEPLIYSTTLDFPAVESVSESRERIHEKLREKLKRSRREGFDIKLASGGIRDIEFLVQCLQRLHGGREPWVRHGGTMMALFRLRDKGFLSDKEYSRLAAAYEFLRNVEHRLQFYEDRQTHTLPTDPEQLQLLSRRLPIAANSLERELEDHLGSVRELYDRVIHSQRGAVAVVSETAQAEFPPPSLARFFEQRAPAFIRLLREAAPVREQGRIEHFLEKISREPSRIEALESNRELARATLDLFEHSGFFAEQLIRHPYLLEEIGEACGPRQGRSGFHAPHDAAGLRRYYREQMVRIQSDSICQGVNVFRTLKRTSDLADSIIAAAYQIALETVHESSSPVNRAYVPSDQMMVLALGRLGMGEFDIASDADLVFAIPDADAPEIVFWTAVAERIVQVIGAYTGDGVMFAVDTRLRPNGREGALVQTEASYKSYFSEHAEAWEGIAYMKARAVTGDVEGATRLLHELQDLDWRRYGQSGRSRVELGAMRSRVEREQGPRNPLKAGVGGYYDLDFALLYLRLKGAGVFFKVLNTPERIDVVEKMGQLDRDDANFLREAATLYRAIDHGMRVATGHADGTLPASPAQLAILGDLVRRWSSTGVEGLPEMRSRMRAFFDRIFTHDPLSTKGLRFDATRE
jgi:glutamate-ammonia-ligase adenylyltransferase